MKVFISHSSRDRRLAEKLVDVLHAALSLQRDEIRFTSVDAYRFPVGIDVQEQLRREVYGADVFIAVLTKASMRSAHVLFELGARWGTNRYIAPVLAGGATAAMLRGPLANLNAPDLSNASQINDFVKRIGDELRIDLRTDSEYYRQVHELVDNAKSSQKPAQTAKDPVSLIDKGPSMRSLLTDPESEDVDFEPPRLGDETPRSADFD